MSKFGKAFPDQFHKHQAKLKHFHPKIDDGRNWQEGFIISNQDNQTQISSVWRKVFFLVILMVSFTVIFIRLFHLQVVEGKDLRVLADSNRIKVKIIHAPRGVIYDRNGKILAQNNPGFRLIEQKNAKTLAKYLSRDEALKLEINSDPRLEQLEVDHIRNYPLGEKTAHILGYMSEINEDELKNQLFEGYKPGDTIGKDGVEEIYESILKGSDGGEIVEVDAEGRKRRILRATPAIPGQNLYLTIDSDLQLQVYKYLEQALNKSKSCCGAAVAEDPKTGQILALVSFPSFDPKNLQNFILDKNSPLLNRVIAGTYPPGSVFKIASSLAGLQSKKITPQTIFEDAGQVSLGTFTFTNWFFSQYGKKEGQVDLVKALKRSNDTYFYQLGQIVGEKEIAKAALALGLGQTLGIDLPGEEQGLIPTDEWKKSKFNEVWYPGDTLHMAIGQGFVLTTPLQLNYLISTIAADGSEYKPHLALKITGPEGNLIKEYNYQPNTLKVDNNDYIKVIKKGLEGVTTAGGTAWPFFSFSIPTAGKTGTAEFGDPKNHTHAWYASYAPTTDPKIALTVLIEAGGEGSNVAAPVAKEVYRWYLSPDKNNLIKDLWEEASPSAKALGE